MRLLAALVLLARAMTAQAQDLEPRSYTNLPIDQTFVLLGYSYSSGDLSPTPTSPLQDAELDVDALVAGVSRTFALAGSSAKADLAAARVCYDGSATFEGEFVERQRCEYGDPQAKLTWNFHGAPALPLSEFQRWEPGLVGGVSLQVSAPLGTYHTEHLINAGTNRWMLRPGLGLSYRLGSWYLDFSGSVSLFEDNDSGFRGARLEQDPIYAVQSHVVYLLGRGAWLSLNGNFFRGGETTLDGVRRDDLQENSRVGVTLSVSLSPRHSLKFNANTGVLTRVGNDFDTLGIAWLYRLGGVSD